ncbi:MAG: DUF429 domain-containing protein, partial [Planctomycetales bacterium]|nr:DUF429 domain-containing protein [Planctomycetales bacterium]
IAECIVPFVDSAARCLVAIDAPLGWPDGLRQLIGEHQAGQSPHSCLSKNLAFRRYTDDVVRRTKVPLEIGADKIARATFEALRVLGELRTQTGKEIPLAWDPSFDGSSAIEVYPGATLVARKLAFGPYKKPGQKPARRQMIEKLLANGLIAFLPDLIAQAAVDDDNVLDALLCLVAGRDFLLGNCDPLTNENADQVRRESWIWLHRGI